MKKGTIIFSTVLALVFSFSLSDRAYAGFSFGLPDAIEKRVEELDKKVEKAEKAKQGEAEKKAEEG